MNNPQFPGLLYMSDEHIKEAELYVQQYRDNGYIIDHTMCIELMNSCLQGEKIMFLNCPAHQKRMYHILCSWVSKEVES